MFWDDANGRSTQAFTRSAPSFQRPSSLGGRREAQTMDSYNRQGDFVGGSITIDIRVKEVPMGRHRPILRQGGTTTFSMNRVGAI